MKKILITGGCGFVGSHLTEFIYHKYRKSKIIIFDKITYAGSIENLKNIISSKRVKLIKKDINNIEALKKSFVGVDLVINAAAESHVDNSFNLTDEFVITNVLGTKHILDMCKKYRTKKIIHISTDEIYGEIKKNNFKETSSFNPSNPYSSSKAAAEMIINGYSYSYKLPTIIVRANNIFGTRQHPEKLIAGCCWSLIKGKKFYLHGSGKQKRSFLYIGDFCKAISLLIEKGKRNEIYNVGSNFEYENLDIAKIITKKMKVDFKKNISFTKDRPFNDFRYSIDYNKIKALGWTPKIKVEDKIQEIIEWYKKNINRYPKRFI